MMKYKWDFRKIHDLDDRAFKDFYPTIYDVVRNVHGTVGSTTKYYISEDTSRRQGHWMGINGSKNHQCCLE